MNQWQLEGYSRTYNDPYGKRFSLMDGDVIFYHADQSSKGILNLRYLIKVFT